MIINGTSYDLATLKQEAAKWTRSTGWEADIWQFMHQWLDDSDSLTLMTSGSTGTPKKLEMPKRSMRASAAQTCAALKLSKDNHFFLCIPAKYVGGKMMIVRALEIGASISWTTPSSLPIFQDGFSQADFTAMIPLQVSRLIDELGNTMSTFGKIIIGGAPLSNQLEQRLRRLNLPIWQTFGMTETASHIALRKVSDENASDIFTTLNGVSVYATPSGTLGIEAKYVSSNSIETNDLVEVISPTSFRWLGRADNVINSGGLKIIPEVIETTMSAVLKTEFFIHSVVDEALGQRLILCIEGEQSMGNIHLACQEIENKNKRPKEAWFVAKFSRTETGKVRRDKSAESVSIKKML